MSLAGLLREDMVFTTCCSSKELLFQELSERMVSVYGHLSHEEILEALQQREEEMTTGIGLGVAIPHGRLHSIEHPAMVFLRLEEGISEYDSLDGRPVHFVFGLLTPRGSEHLHCAILKDVSLVLSHEQNRERLLQARSTKDIYSILLNSSCN